MQRRTFIILLGCGAALCPRNTKAQSQGGKRLAISMGVGKTPEYLSAVAGFKETLGSLGWNAGENIDFNELWSAGGPAQARSAAAEILALKPDAIFAQSSAVVEALKKATAGVPIVFVHVADPVAEGIVPSLAHPGGNITGITNIEPSIGGKWLQLLKEAAPTVTRAAMLVNPASWSDEGALFLHPFEEAAKALGVSMARGDVGDLESVEAIMRGLAAKPGGGVVVTPDALFGSHSGQIVALAERLRLPVAYPYRYYVAQGGLLCYGVNNGDLFRQAASYIARILKGETPNNLPVQQPTRFDLVVNLKTARALGLRVPHSLIARADEIIE
jgi:putative ABC transport system substrate-binding protein